MPYSGRSPFLLSEEEVSDDASSIVSMPYSGRSPFLPSILKNVGIIGDFRPVFAGYFQTILSLYYFPAKICLFIICSYFPSLA